MSAIKLDLDEKIIMQTDYAGRYDGNIEINIDELYLTNKNIIYVYEKSKGIFSKPETIVEKIPLTTISVVRGVVQVELVNDDNYGKSLQIVYTNGKRDWFELNVAPKKQYPAWKTAIIEAVLDVNRYKNMESVGEVHPYTFCTSCGKKLNADAKFCSKCGSPVNKNSGFLLDEDRKREQSIKTKENAISKSFFEKSEVCRVTMTEKTMSLRKSYIISDVSGNVLYTAKSEGLPQLPEFGLYRNDKRVGCACKEMFANPVLGNPTFTLHLDNKRIASLLQKFSLKPKFEITENGWKFDAGLMKSTVYDCNGQPTIQIQYVMSTKKGGFIVEYSNKENEAPAILFALTVVLLFYMG